MKGIPIGVQDFKRLRDEDFYFVDKTALIDRMLGRNTPVFLFTRPRRFGKSLMLSMLDAYLSDEYPDNRWFDDLEISGLRPNDSEKNANPVIFLDMKCLGNGTYTRFLYLLREKVVQLYIDALKPENASELEDDPGLLFPAMDTEEGVAGLKRSLSELLELVRDKSGKNAILIIDEYDDAVNNARDTPVEPGGESHRRKILDFLRDFYGGALRGDGCPRLAVLAGIMPIETGSMFSEIDGFVEDSVLNPVYGEAFGFTESEVRELCEAYGHPDRFDEARRWYDGYRLGGSRVYNPWSILNYIFREFAPSTYWAATSCNDIIDKLLDSLDPNTCLTFERMLKGEGTVETLCKNVTCTDMGTDSDPSALLSAMVMSGYLCAVPVPGANGYRISIPNLELREVFMERFATRLG